MLLERVLLPILLERVLLPMLLERALLPALLPKWWLGVDVVVPRLGVTLLLRGVVVLLLPNERPVLFPFEPFSPKRWLVPLWLPVTPLELLCERLLPNERLSWLLPSERLSRLLPSGRLLPCE